jgi:formate dehydrogenase major subunit
MSKLNIIINGNIIPGNKGESILDLASRTGIEIPTLCYDPRLEPYSSCYLCVVEVEGMRGLQPACSTRIAEGMRIETENERVKKSRKFALDLLVSNHYADCVAPCKETCPAGVDVQGYIALMNRGRYHEATALIKKTNPLPAICGRVCVRPCEVACRRNLVDGSGVGIDYLKRFAADTDLFSENRYIPQIKPATGKKVAIMGAGPGGLSAAWFLALEGHAVEIFEASAHAGGMLRYGIPPYRLPNEVIEKEVEGITALGVRIHYNSKLGENLSYRELKKNYNAVVLAIGSQNGTSIGCENDDAGNIFSGIDFLRNMEITGQRYDFTGKKVAVIGGGNTAMDCCRTAMRCGSTDVMVLYRRTEKEMPANPIEIHESKLEGIDYHFLTAPAKVVKDENGNLKSLVCFRMELGEPDASGRRRPVKVEGSEFEIELDYILAAIGQKTHVNFIDDINRHTGEELIINKWGDIQADAKTLQTSIASIFACGDGVTGPATLIEAIAQGRLAAQSCNKYLEGQNVTPPEKEFISHRDNFSKQVKKDYEPWFAHQHRHEMPTMDPAERKNFAEVELGYSAQQATEETQRCLECGCRAVYTCDLKKYATQYQATQKKFGGSWQQFHVDFSHPHIEIDNNKCILCGRCVRICREVVGANALGLVNRGFETYVAPSLGTTLAETNCESCGMCISTCPTGALTENVNFKPGPWQLQSYQSVCNYCSVGCTLEYHHKSGFVAHVEGTEGLVNHDGNICGLPRFNYGYINDRITQPLIKKDGQFAPVSFDEAYNLITEKLKSTPSSKSAFFAGARLTNEEIYLIQKLARLSARTSNISSFHYLQRGSYLHNAEKNVPFHELYDAGKIYLLGSEVNQENGVAGFYIYNASHLNNIPLTLITDKMKTTMDHKVSQQIRIKSYYHFLKAVIYFILDNKLENRIFIDDHTTGFEDYRKQILQENFHDLLELSGCAAETIAHFAMEYNDEQHAVMVFAEKNLSSHTCTEIRNLSLITGKTGKTASGIIALKEKNNSQGIFDMGAGFDLAPGGKPWTEETINTLKEIWETGDLSPASPSNPYDLLEQGSLSSIFIFGEDPVGCAINKPQAEKWLQKASFVMVQDYYLTETAQMADLVLPATLPYETGGSFTNTQKYIQQFQQETTGPVKDSAFRQLVELHNRNGLKANYETPADVMSETASILHNAAKPEQFQIVYTVADNPVTLFDHGCDAVQAMAVKNRII